MATQRQDNNRLPWNRPSKWHCYTVFQGDLDGPLRTDRTMSLTPQDIQRLANLARLELQPAHSERLLGQMNVFFDIVEQMRAVDTTGIEPLAHPVATIQDIALRLRDDAVSEPNAREANQKSAPAVENGLFLVPKVIE